MTNEQNPLLDQSLQIPFDTIRAEHVRPAIDALLASTSRGLDAIHPDGPVTYANTLGALDSVTEPLDRALGIVGHLESVTTYGELRDAYTEVQPKAAALYSQIPLREPIWRALQAFSQTAEARALDSTRKRFLEKTLDEFKRHGANLPDEGKRKLSELDVELSKVTTQFSQNVLDATGAFELVITDEKKLAGLPESAIDAARQSASQRGKEGWRFTLQAPSVIAVLKYMDDRPTREAMWRAHNTRATSGTVDNRPLIARILDLRRQRAALLGYDNFADLVLSDRMAHKGRRAREFVRELTQKTRPFFEKETAELTAFAKKAGGPARLEPWDLTYYAEKQRRELYDFDEEAVRPYFAAPRIIEGLFEIAHRLYGIDIKPINAPVWHKDVSAYSMRDANGELARFYVDIHPRDTKRDGAWMAPFITGTPRPHVALVCANATPPVGDAPALLTHREVETLFHEFGHLLHQCLSEVPVRTLAGTNVAWDFVELPSQIMENWCWKREALDLFARHYQTGATLPEDLYEKMQRAKNYRSASAMMQQLGYAATDLALHMDYEPSRDGDVMAFARARFQEYFAVPLPADYSMLASFSHLFSGSVGYAAGYYSYKWAEVLDADAFGLFEERGVFSQEAGAHFREHILSKGDSRDPAELFRTFRGREPKMEALLQRSGLLADAELT